MRLVALTFIAGLAACSAPDDYAGDIVSSNGSMVIIEGVMNQPSGMDVQPTPAMRASATRACGSSAEFVSWTNDRVGHDGYNRNMVDAMLISYRFLCS